MRADALARGIKPETVQQAFAALDPLPVVVERDRTQAEFALTLEDYLAQRFRRAWYATPARRSSGTSRCWSG